MTSNRSICNPDFCAINSAYKSNEKSFGGFIHVSKNFLLNTLGWAFTSYSFKPQLKTLGPKYGKIINDIRKELTALDGNTAMDTLNAEGSLKLEIGGQTIELMKEDLLIEMTQLEGFVANSDKGITVVMDTNLTPELIEEGFVREIVSKIQTMRKDAGFEVMDRIVVTVCENDKLEDLIHNNSESIKKIVLADTIENSQAKGFIKEWDINGEKVTLGVEKVSGV